MELCVNNTKVADIFIIGGESLYRYVINDYMPCRFFFLTQIHNEFEYDVNISVPPWIGWSRRPHKLLEIFLEKKVSERNTEKGIDYTFKLYERSL